MSQEIENYIKIEDYINVKERAKTLGCNISDYISILPLNFASASSKEHFIHESNTKTIKKIMRKEGLLEQ